MDIKRDSSNNPFAKLSAEEVFPFPNETAEEYMARMNALAFNIAAITSKMDDVAKDKEVTKDVYESRQKLARNLANEIMKDTGRTTLPPLTGSKPSPHQSFVLDAAKRIVYGPRQHMYGHASINFDRTAHMWEPIFGNSVNKLQVGLAMILLKVARGGNLVQREAEGGAQATFDEIEDTMKDIAGYAEATMRALFETPDGDRTTK